MCGASNADAEAVAASLIESERAGHASHGLLRVTEYVRQIEAGVIAVDARPAVAEDHQTVAVVDGNGAFGQVVAGMAIELLIKRALEHGVAAVTVRNCGHVGRAGVYVERAALNGLFAMVFVNGGGVQPRVAPHGGARPVFGTNPVAAAFPVGGSDPLVVDFSTAVVASGKIRVFRDRGELLPDGWILDREGRASTDPRDYYDGGMLLPAAGHKGYGLSLLCEGLAGCLSGAGALVTDGSAYRVGNGMFMHAARLDFFTSEEAFAASTQKLADTVRATPPAPGVNRVMLPGDPERASIAMQGDTVSVSESTWSAITELARRLHAER